MDKNFLWNQNLEFFALAKTGKRILHPVLSFIIFFPLLFLPFISTEILADLLFDLKVMDREWKMLYTFYFSFGAVYLAVWAWVKFVEKRSFSSLGFVKKYFPQDYFKGFLSGFVMMTAVVLLLALTGNVSFQTNVNFATGFSAASGVFLFLIGFIVQGGAEEVVTRGWLMQVMGARHKPWSALLVTSVLFAVLHMGNNGATFFAAFNLLLFGLFLGLYVIRTGNIWGACGWHAAWNWTMGNIYGLEVSGASPAGGSIINLQFGGSELLSGGLFGPEGSIVTTLVLMAGIVLLVILKRNIAILEQSELLKKRRK